MNFVLLICKQHWMCAGSVDVFRSVSLLLDQCHPRIKDHCLPLTWTAYCDLTIIMAIQELPVHYK
jgi:hypothetical protein